MFPILRSPGTARGWRASWPLSSHSSQSSPNSSTGCWVRIVPFPQRRSSAEQYLSHPQQIRSGCFGFSASFGFDMAILVVLQKSSFTSQRSKGGVLGECKGPKVLAFPVANPKVANVNKSRQQRLPRCGDVEDLGWG